MILQDAALIGAGVIGGVVALIHGALTERLMVRPVAALMQADRRTGAPVSRLVPLLLRFSTFNWLIGGLALVAAGLWLDGEARFAIGLLVGSAYLFAALGNLWGVRTLHPGWMLLTAALGLMAYGLWPSAV